MPSLRGWPRSPTTGKLTVEVAQTFGLDEVASAFALSQAGHVRGKLIIVP